LQRRLEVRLRLLIAAGQGERVARVEQRHGALAREQSRRDRTARKLQAAVAVEAAARLVIRDLRAEDVAAEAWFELVRIDARERLDGDAIQVGLPPGGADQLGRQQVVPGALALRQLGERRLEDGDRLAVAVVAHQAAA